MKQLNQFGFGFILRGLQSNENVQYSVDGGNITFIIERIMISSVSFHDKYYSVSVPSIIISQSFLSLLCKYIIIKLFK